MPSSPIRKLAPFEKQAKKAGKQIIHLNIGQPDIKTPSIMLDAIKSIDINVIAYTQSGGNESYREKLTSYYRKHDITLTPEQIIVTTGGSEALLFGLLTCLDAEDEVIIPEPFYANYNGFTTLGNIKTIPINSTIENGFALPAIKEFETAITPKTKAILICNPNNPTGYLYAREELELLKEIVIKHNLFLFVDEVYREFTYDNKTHTSILQLDDLENHAIVIDSISKRYSACGARIGALLTRNQEVLDGVMKIAQARLSPPAIEQIAAEAAIDVPDEYMQQTIKEYIARRNYVVEALNNIEGVNCPKPSGAFYCIVELPIDNAEDFCRWLLTDFEYNNYTLMLAPATGFYSSPHLGKNQVRLAYVLEIPLLSIAIDCLDKALKAYKNQ